MDSFILSVIENFALSTVIASALTSLITLIIDKFLPDNFPFAIKSALPFVLGTVINFGYFLIVDGAKIDVAEVMSCGILCGSLSIGIKSLFCGDGNIFSDSRETLKNSVKSVLKDFQKDSFKDQTADKICSVLSDETLTEEEIYQKTEEILTEDYPEKSQEEIKNLVRILRELSINIRQY